MTIFSYAALDISIWQKIEYDRAWKVVTFQNLNGKGGGIP
jgi:hypothetical protein